MEGNAELRIARYALHSQFQVEFQAEKRPENNLTPDTQTATKTSHKGRKPSKPGQLAAMEEIILISLLLR